MRAKRSESVAKAFACCADLPTRSNTNRCPLAIDCVWDSPLLVPPSERISRIGSIRKLRGYPQLRGDGFVCNLPRRRREGAHRVGEKQNQPFQISFDISLEDNLQGPRVTSDGGVVLVRDLNERVGVEKLIEEHLSSSR